MRTTNAAIAAYREWQEQLERHGCTDVAADLFLELCRHIEADPCLDVEGFEAVLEQLHVRAYPDARTRPPRLTAGELQSILED